MEPEQSQSLTPEQRSSEWFEARLGRVTASRVADTMAFYAPTRTDIAKAAEWHVEHKTDGEWLEYLLDNFPTEYCLLAGIELKETAKRKTYRENIVAERLTGIQADPEPYVSYDMKWGIANEAIAKNVYQLTYRRLIEEAPFVEHKKLMAGASPDGYVTDADTGEVGVAEIKCLRSANHLYKAIMTQEVPPEHIPQIQMQMWVCGYYWCDFIAYDSRVPEGLKIFVQRVPRDENYIKVLESQVRRFLAECDNDFKHFWASVKDKHKVEIQNGIVKKPAEAIEKSPASL